ncbi:MAG TPA: FKBP-type peptidyl-prolyl cis-trans isomerase [Patescibacteria group bacterium]|nr:FKBP-type peptidyl-prolyl cis-trans isomerase [Patescibacteria group bacterium]
MSKSFLLFAGACIIALIVFIYFIFGFNQTAPAESPTPDVIQTTSADLKIEEITQGSGAEVKAGDTILIHYKGTLPDGTQFDSSYDRGEPFETQIGVGQVIQGWDQGVIGMKVGGKRTLTIPPSLGYGDQAAGSIPPNSTLIFELELLDIK